jgi:hypothetical protein
MFPDPKIKCHHTAFTRSCREIIAECDCPKFVKVVGVNKNTGEPIDKTGCVDSFLHVLQIETASVIREVAGEVSMHRKEILDQGLRIMENQVSLDANLRTMHGQASQIALMQIKAQLPDPNQSQLPFLEHQGNA